MAGKKRSPASNSRRSFEKGSLSRGLTSFLGQRIIMGLALVAAMLVVLIVNPTPVGIQEGKPAPRTYRATRAIQYVDEEATQQARDEAWASVDPVYVRDLQAAANARAEVSDFFAAVRAAKELYSDDSTLSAEALREARVKTVLDSYDGPVSEEIVSLAVSLSDSELFQVDTQTRELVTIVLNDTILPEQLPDARQRLATNADLLPMSATARRIVSAVGQAVLRPTLELDEEATAKAREEAMEKVEPIVITKQPGENIVVRGQIVTAEQVELLKILGVFDNSTDWPALLASILLLSGMVFASGTYLALYEERVWNRRRDLAVIGVLLFFTVLLTRLIVWLYPEVSPYVLPYPVIVMLVTLLLNARVGLLAAVMSAIAGSLLGLSSGVYVVAVLLVNILATIAMSRMRERSHLFFAGAFVSVSMGVVSFLATLASTSSWRDALTSGAYGLAGGVLAAIITYGLLPFFEVVFRITTDVRLLELANPAHPLMRRLMMEAPGTYNHSVLTANLAEAAAEDIGADPLLARVGAYYHDIGKIRRPLFFLENQVGGENPHDETSPSLSTLIITSHVKDGLELAKEYKLPEEVRDIIAQHHGTSVVTYFYGKARSDDESVNADDFRYEGERPRSREAALVMLADSAEAVARTVKKPTPERMEQVVRRVAKDKLEDGQLDESALTLADIDKIVKRYAQMLSGVYHRRVDYPEGVDAQRKASSARTKAADSRPQVAPGPEE